MRKLTIIVRNEIDNYRKNIAILAIVVLPIFMSKMISYTMHVAGQETFLLSVWILFAQLMVGIMLTGPNLVEEREMRTFDALLCTPVSFRFIILSKGLATLCVSIVCQLCVYILNTELSSSLLLVLIPMVVGGSIFTLVGIVIGLKVNSSQTCAAVASTVMVVLFIVVSVYQAFPDWLQTCMVLIPSISVAGIINDLMQGQVVSWIEVGITTIWLVMFLLWVRRIEKLWTR